MIDGSGSIVSEEFQLQLEGFAAAIEDPGVIPTDESVAVTVIQFSSNFPGGARTEIPYAVIESPVQAATLASSIRAISQGGGGTPIAAGLRVACEELVANARVTASQTVLMATDGVENAGGNPAIEAGSCMLRGIEEWNVIAIELTEEEANDRYGNLVFPQPNTPGPPLSSGFVTVVQDFEEFKTTVGSVIDVVVNPGLTSGFDVDPDGVPIDGANGGVGTEVSMTFQSVGIRITGRSGATGFVGAFADDPSNDPSSADDIVPISAPNVLVTKSSLDDDSSDWGAIEFSFEGPESGESTPVEFFEVWFLDVEDSGFGSGGRNVSRLEAFDANGTLVDQYLVPAAPEDETLKQVRATVGAIGSGLTLSRVIAYVGDADDSAALDEVQACLTPSPLEVAVLPGQNRLVPGEDGEILVIVSNPGTREHTVELLFSAGIGDRSRVFSVMEGTSLVISPESSAAFRLAAKFPAWRLGLIGEKVRITVSVVMQDRRALRRVLSLRVGRTLPVHLD